MAWEDTARVIGDIAVERRRQIDDEGWTPERDDTRTDGELALAAALYAVPYENPRITQNDFLGLQMALDLGADWKLKPHADKRRRLVIAGALLVAEIERLDRQKEQDHE